MLLKDIKYNDKFYYYKILASLNILRSNFTYAKLNSDKAS